MNDQMKPAVIGGVALGLLSAIPFVSTLNACCCAWAVGGGLLASYLYIKSSPAPVTPGVGAKIGAIAGVIGAIIYVVIGTPLSMMASNASIGMIGNLMASINPEAGEVFRRQAEVAQNMSVAELLIASIPSALMIGLLLIGFATIGGLLGVTLFEKRKDGPGMAPPPPADYGGFSPTPPAGGFGTGT